MDAMNELKTKIEKSINYFEEDLTSIRVGKASAGVLDRIMVNYYGTDTPINQMATVSATDAHYSAVGREHVKGDRKVDPEVGSRHQPR